MSDYKKPEGMGRELAKKIVLLYSGDEQLVSRIEKEIARTEYEAAHPTKKDLSPAIAEAARVLIWDPDSSEISGTELHDALAQKKDMAIVVIRKSDKPDMRVEALQLGACEYMTKPVSEQELRDVVGRALHKVNPQGEKSDSEKSEPETPPEVPKTMNPFVVNATEKKFMKNFLLSMIRLNETTVIDKKTGEIIQRIPTDFSWSGVKSYCKSRVKMLRNLLGSMHRIHETTVFDRDTGEIVERIQHG